MVHYRGHVGNHGCINAGRRVGKTQITHCGERGKLSADGTGTLISVSLTCKPVCPAEREIEYVLFSLKR
jgi:hypothetical protein